MSHRCVRGGRVVTWLGLEGGEPDTVVGLDGDPKILATAARKVARAAVDVRLQLGTLALYRGRKPPRG